MLQSYPQVGGGQRQGVLLAVKVLENVVSMEMCSRSSMRSGVRDRRPGPPGLLCNRAGRGLS